jgi:glycosyltransferase involved in cell wall biosynthesis
MKIAYVVPYVPNQIRTRPYNLIKQLAALGHNVAVFTLGSNGQDLTDAQALKDECSDVYYFEQPVWRSLLNSVAALPSRQPLQSVYSWQAGMAKNLAERITLNEFDLVHVEHLRGSRYGISIKSMFPNMLVVWDSVDCISHLFRQAANQSNSFFGKFITRMDLSRTIRAEGDLICRFDHVLVTSAVDKNALLELAPRGKEPSPISVLPNGVDLDYFHPNPEIERDKASIVFSGKMSYHANISMVKYLVSRIMPLVWKTHPETHLFIVGKDPPSDIRELDRNHSVTVTGTVEDIRPYLWRATVSIVPLLYGAGIQNKILEAMATGTPVITTHQALSALEVQPEKDILIANNEDEFAQSILRIIESEDLKYVIGKGGVAYVKKKHDWTAIASRVTEIYQSSLDEVKYSLANQNRS